MVYISRCKQHCIIFIDYGVVSLDMNSQMQFAVIMPRQRGRGGGVGRLSRYQRYRQSQQSHPTTTHTSNPIDPKQLQREFESELEKLDLFECTNCHRLQLKSEEFDKCSKCKTNPNKFTAVNNMDPGAVPLEFQDLTVIKQLLIARVQPVMRVYRVRSRGNPGQYAYKGNIINIGQNITDVARSLPRVPSSLSIVIVRREVLDKHRDFHVRREKVVNALRFFKLNNPYYANVEIDTEKISQLPVNGSIHAQIQTVEIPENTESVEEESEQIYESIVPQKIKISEAGRIQSELDNAVPFGHRRQIL